MLYAYPAKIDQAKEGKGGVDIYRVKELLGHKTLMMTARYAHHYPESLRESVEILDACYRSATVGVGGTAG